MIHTNRKYYSLSFFFILGSILIHSYLTFHHFQVRYLPQLGPSICNLNSAFNCDAVAVSKYSELFGIPLASMGLVSNFILLIFLIISRFSLSIHSGSYEKLSFFLSGMIALTSLVMLGVSSFLISTYCLFCLGAYLLSFLTFAALYFVKPENNKTTHGLFSELVGPMRSATLAIVLIPAISWIFSSFVSGQLGSQNISELKIRSLTYWQEAQTHSFNVDSGLIQKGDSNQAKMTIVEFADFLCPHCKLAGPSIKSFVTSRNDVQLIFKFYPLDSACNGVIKSETRGGARCLLAGATYCAEKLHQKGWKMYEKIFEYQEDFSDNSSWIEIWSKVKSVVSEAEEKSITECVQSEQTFEAIRQQAREGELANVSGTPTIFVNGKKLEFGQMPGVLEAVYEQLN